MLRFGWYRLVYRRLHRKYRDWTQVPESSFAKNLFIAARIREVPGCIIECGVWRGGMSAAIAEVLGPRRHYFLFDSFQGMPAPTERDGERAAKWASGDSYYRDNNRAPIEQARAAMRLSPASNVAFVEGWFNDTIPGFVPPEPIALLRLDGDWYESTMICLKHLFPHLAPRGVVIIDDYRAWDGCARAVNEFLANQSNGDGTPPRLWQFGNDVYYLTKYH
ncbi:MAG: TylF/MycF/NovP-related O-methyltransferase [Candidatus Binataceae bacterium]